MASSQSHAWINIIFFDNIPVIHLLLLISYIIVVLLLLLWEGIGKSHVIIHGYIKSENMGNDSQCSIM